MKKPPMVTFYCGSWNGYWFLQRRKLTDIDRTLAQRNASRHLGNGRIAYYRNDVDAAPQIFTCHY